MGAMEFDWRSEAEKLVEWSIVPRGIRKMYAEVFKKVPRHEFVPERMRVYAYEDRPLPIGFDQTISQPSLVAFMTQAVDAKAGDMVLDVGTGSGYQAAILAELGCHVYSVEFIPELAFRARDVFEKLGYEVFQVVGDANAPFKDESFDAIIVACSLMYYPRNLFKALKVGGKAVYPIGGRYFQDLVLAEKREDKVYTRRLLSCAFVPMKGGYAWKDEE